MKSPPQPRARGKQPGAQSRFAQRQSTAGAHRRHVPEVKTWRPPGVRRQLAALERAITQAIRWAVFEVHGEALWARVREAVEVVLTQEWNGGNLRGERADQAFFVRCDRTTMTEQDIANARLVVLAGVACVRPSEFTVLRVLQSTAG